MTEPAFTPEYRKPDAPGVSMNFDNSMRHLYFTKVEDVAMDPHRCALRQMTCY